jgi:glycerophosphoryl diester phosphodiesterase
VGAVGAAASARAFALHDHLLLRRPGPKAGAHQGGLYEFGENTLGQFERAARAGVDVIEMDLRTTSDGVAVVFHDDQLDGGTNCRGKIAEQTFAQLQGCRYRTSGRPIPTFEEIVRTFQGTGVVVNAEFKSPSAISPAVELVRRYGFYDQVYFQTKNNPALYRKARAADPDVVLLFAPKDETQLKWILKVQDPALLVIELHPNLRKPEFIQRIHADGKLVSENSWHFDGLFEVFGSRCRAAFDHGIDIAISNRPAGCVRDRDRFAR